MHTEVYGMNVPTQRDLPYIAHGTNSTQYSVMVHVEKESEKREFLLGLRGNESD